MALALGRLNRLKPFRSRLPVVLQLSPDECGATCLAMILRHFGRQVSMSACREQVGGGQKGVTALMIANAARRMGLEVKSYRLEPANLSIIQSPAILHWNNNHFVVLERWSPEQVDIVDPALGRCRLSQDEFATGFSGIALTFAPGETFYSRPAEQVSSTVPAWRVYLRHLLRIPGIKAGLAQILGASLLLQLLGLLLPFLTGLIVDWVLPTGAVDMMTTLGIGLALLLLAQVVMTWLRTVLVITLQTRLDARLMLTFFERLLALPYRFFQERTSGDLLARLDSNVAIRETLTTNVITTLLDGALVVVYLVILLWTGPLFGLIVSGVALFQAVLLLSTTGAMHQLTRQYLVAQAEEEGYLVEALRGIETIKAGGAEERVFDHWARLFFKTLRVSLQRNQVSVLVQTTLGALHNLVPLLLLWIGVHAVLAGAMSAGAMLALTVLAVYCLVPLTMLVSNIQQLQLVRAHLDRLVEVMDAEPEQPPAFPFISTDERDRDKNTALPVKRLSGQIELQDVSFSYAPHLPPVLRDISLTIAPGQKIALVGRTGAGKSTLARLLLGLYPPTGGQIYYDGLSIRQLDYRWLRSQFGVALQDVFLMSGSIRQNIAFNAPDLPLAQVIQAAKVAAIHDEIMRLPMGYETRVAEGGSGLSGGQRQRLALARALAPQPNILLLDEATSHLDTLTEQLIDRNLDTLGCTRLIIAHRLSTVRTANLILVLDQGRIIEQGAHAELMALNGVYTSLAQNQATNLNRDTCRLNY